VENKKTENMKSDEIKQECEKMYAQIEQAEKRLKEVRAICKHENTFEGNYSYRVGAISLAEICSDCHEFIKYVQ
jgi:hypothetical protein